MTVEKLENSRVRVIFSVTADEFEQAILNEFKKLNLNCDCKDYEKSHKISDLYDGALNGILSAKAQELKGDEKLSNKIVGPLEPDVSGDGTIKRGKDFKISFSFDVYPEVNLPQYKGLKVRAKNTVVTEEEVEEAVRALLLKSAVKTDKKDGILSVGDIAVFDFVGMRNGKEFEGGKADNYELKIGSRKFIAGFEEQMSGMRVGEVKTINVTFPENYGEKSLAGQPATFKITLHKVLKEVLPALTDGYVRGLNVQGVATVAQLYEFKRRELTAEKEKKETDRQIDEIVNMILDADKTVLPKSLIEERVAGVRAQYEQQAKAYNIPFDKFLKLLNITEEKFNAETYEQGKRQAQFNVVVAKIIEVENLAPTRNDLEAEAEREAKLTGKPKEELLKANAPRYYSFLAYKAVTKMLLDNAVTV